jgi:hypothetical protein
MPHSCLSIGESDLPIAPGVRELAIPSFGRSVYIMRSTIVAIVFLNGEEPLLADPVEGERQRGWVEEPGFS